MHGRRRFVKTKRPKTKGSCVQTFYVALPLTAISSDKDRRDDGSNCEKACYYAKYDRDDSPDASTMITYVPGYYRFCAKGVGGTPNISYSGNNVEHDSFLLCNVAR
ncbi:hypothetical protein NPX13_g8461 [Xylaria arbuscula]|uniref:Uncharacterized protein n=1 Tax=Xylaria arbuscula TaxID=114810 RepID=A0A9W8N8X0_9PEZI|nr:hypothetical protein NPX13_g8461 [Xylaria arbuscula]